MVNFFDQFDPPAQKPRQPAPANFFDQFEADPTAAAPQAPAAESDSVLGIPVSTEADPIVESTRGSLLPIARTQSGRGVAALPAPLEQAQQTIQDLISGRRQASEISGEEVFNLGGLFSGTGAATRAGTAPIAQRAVGQIEDLAETGVTAASAASQAARQQVKARFPDLPETETLRAISQNAFKRAEEAGVALKPEAFSSLATRISKKVDEASFDPRLHKDSAAVLQRIAESVQSGQLASLAELTTLRRLAQGVTKSTNVDDARIAGTIMRQIDNALDNVGTRELVGDATKARQGIKDLKEARLFWKRFRKAEAIDDLIDRAQTSAPNFSGSGLENALRTEFRSLAKNKKRLRVFTPAEQAAIKRVARGGPIENLLRQIGKFAPTGVVSSTLGIGAGAALGGPVGAVALPAAGFAARQGATAATRRNVDLVNQLVRGVRPQ